jgi:tripeptide aminopeptidase
MCPSESAQPASSSRPLHSLAKAPFTSPLAEQLAEDLLDRFLRYVKVDTTPAEGTGTKPSTERQLDLTRLLVEELKQLGVEDARVHEDGYALARIPGRDADGAPVVGLMAHVDTSPSESGANVKPQVIRGYEGGEIALPGVPDRPLRPEDSELLPERIGHDIVTTDGTTLLGADDKAGVAEIMAAVAYLVRSDEPHAPLHIAFTVDEEIGAGALAFDIDAFAADFAYTVDGTTAGEIDDETFSAFEANVIFHGYGVHPGTAKGKLVNAVKLASKFISSLPTDTLSPETTDDREGFVHPTMIRGHIGEVRIDFIVRDFDTARLGEHVALLTRLAEEAVAGEPRASVEVRTREQYHNMKDVLRQRPEIVDAAVEAVRRAGLEPINGTIRGGTDGSILTERGLPTPNIFTGGNEYHSVYEWASVQDMAAAAATLVELARIWAEPEWAARAAAKTASAAS